jgi:hypothetical protein
MTVNGIAVLFSLVALLAFGELWAQKPARTITGTVKKAETYRGKVRAVYIEDHAEGDFLVARGTDISKELIKQVGATVRATGYVRKSIRDPEYALVIDILSYEIDPPPADATVTPEQRE